MVDTGIVQKLLELLDRHVEEGNVTVQHAALSALRNLAIPGGSPHPQAIRGPYESEAFRGLLGPTEQAHVASLGRRKQGMFLMLHTYQVSHRVS